MKKQNLIDKLLNQKAENNNTIDLHAYAIGLNDMYEELNQDKTYSPECGSKRWWECLYWNKQERGCLNCYKTFVLLNK